MIYRYSNISYNTFVELIRKHVYEKRPQEGGFEYRTTPQPLLILLIEQKFPK